MVGRVGGAGAGARVGAGVGDEEEEGGAAGTDGNKINHPLNTRESLDPMQVTSSSA